MVPWIAAFAYRSRTLAVLAVIAGILAVPVQCHLQSGPHSLFVPVTALMESHHHHHQHQHQDGQIGHDQLPAAASSLVFIPATEQSVVPVSPLASVEGPVAAIPALLAMMGLVAMARVSRMRSAGRMDWMLALPGAPP
jgi:hypothetical protein